MKPKNQASEQIRIGLSSVIVASFIAVLQVEDKLIQHSGQNIVNLGLSLLSVSAIFSFIFILCTGLEKRFNGNKRLPALAFLDVDRHKELLSSIKTRSYDFSINVYILAPIIIFSFVILKNTGVLGLEPGLGDPKGGILYLFSILMGIMVWNLIGNILSLITLAIDFIELHPRLRILIWSLIIIIFSQAVFLAQDGRSLNDIPWGFMSVLIGTIVAILLALPLIEKMQDRK